MLRKKPKMTTEEDKEEVKKFQFLLDQTRLVLAGGIPIGHTRFVLARFVLAGTTSIARQSSQWFPIPVEIVTLTDALATTAKFIHPIEGLTTATFTSTDALADTISIEETWPTFTPTDAMSSLLPDCKWCGSVWCGSVCCGYDICCDQAFRESNARKKKKTLIDEKPQLQLKEKSTEGTGQHFPHICSKCKGPAYQGFSSFECKANCK
jgi:hypothetical protein